MAPIDYKEFISDSKPPAFSGNLDSVRVEQKDLDVIMTRYHVVHRDRWWNNYSHVSGAERTGRLILKDGRVVSWMVRPGGLATLELPNGEVIYLANSVN